MIRVWLVALSLVSNVLALALPLALIQVYDRIIANQAVGTAIVLFSAVVVAILLDGCVRFARAAIFSRLGNEAEYRLALSVAQQVLAMTRGDLRKFGAGHVVELFAAISRSRDVLVGQSTLALFDAPFAGVFLVLVWFLGGPVVLVPIGVAAVVGLLAFGSAHANRRAAADQFAARADHKTLLIGGASQVELFRSRGLAGDLMARLRATEAMTAAATEKSERHTSALMDLTQVASLAASVGILGVGAQLASQGDMTSGTVAACLILGQRAVAGLVGILSGLARRQTAAAAYRRLRDALDDRDAFLPDALAAEASGPVGLSWVTPDRHSVDVAPGGFKIVAFDTFRAADRAHAALSDAIIRAGNSGAAPAVDTGLRLSTGDQDLAADQAALAGRVALVGTMPSLLRGTVMDNLTGFDPDRIGAAVSISEQLGLDRPIARLANGFQTEVGARFGAPLSSGGIKRVGLVRALAGAPGLIVLNNPAHALDQDGVDRLAACLHGLRDKTTVVVFVQKDVGAAFAGPPDSNGARGGQSERPAA